MFVKLSLQNINTQVVKHSSLSLVFQHHKRANEAGIYKRAVAMVMMA